MAKRFQSASGIIGGHAYQKQATTNSFLVPSNSCAHVKVWLILHISEGATKLNSIISKERIQTVNLKCSAKICWFLTFWEIIHVEIPALTGFYQFKCFTVFLTFCHRNGVFFEAGTKRRWEGLHLQNSPLKLTI